MKKIYVLDTSVLIHDPYSFKKFKGTQIIIPVGVLDELDKLKKLPNETGKNARICIKNLDKIAASGEIHQGIKLENGAILKIDSFDQAGSFGEDSYVDNKILACATHLKEKKRGAPQVILVSKDINLRVRGQAAGIKTEDYEEAGNSTQELYSGVKTIESEKLGGILLDNQFLDIKNHSELKDILHNECIYFVDKNQEGLALGRRSGEKIKQIFNKNPWGLSPRNREQVFAIDLLMDPKIPLVSLIGKAGSGKTLCALACALELVLEKKMYNKLMIYRPIKSVGGNDIGFLPGEMEQKLAPWFSAIYDSFEVLFDDKNNWETTLKMYQDKNKINLEAITYVRGRSLPNSLILIDEMQNLNREDVKTILTRAGSGTKVICVGDIEQLDDPKLDSLNNGLTYIVEKFKNSHLAGHVTLMKGERSELATLAAEIL